MNLIHGVREQADTAAVGKKYVSFEYVTDRSPSAFQSVLYSPTSLSGVYLKDDNGDNREINFDGTEKPSEYGSSSGDWRYPIPGNTNTLELFTVSGATETVVAEIDLSSIAKYANIILTDYIDVPMGMVYNGYAFDASPSAWPSGGCMFWNMTDALAEFDLRSNAALGVSLDVVTAVPVEGFSSIVDESATLITAGDSITVLFSMWNGSSYARVDDPDADGAFTYNANVRQRVGLAGPCDNSGGYDFNMAAELKFNSAWLTDDGGANADFVYP